MAEPYPLARHQTFDFIVSNTYGYPRNNDFQNAESVIFNSPPLLSKQVIQKICHRTFSCTILTNQNEAVPLNPHRNGASSMQLLDPELGELIWQFRCHMGLIVTP